ncbi:MAG: 3-dehydroquinate synthase [Candidatus Izemoplasmatales bacterium]
MKLTVHSSRFDYDIFLENNLLDNIENYIDVSKRYFVIADDNIPIEIVSKIINKFNDYIFINFPEGEKSKSLEEYSRIINLLLEKGITKDSTLIAVGGGVTGDLVGFISSTLYRGINYIQVPTTLLSQIDSSVGGKVAINANNTKNAVGTIYPPKLVLIDPTTLSTLPRRHFNNGMSEMIKYGMINSEKLFNIIKNKDVQNNLVELIYECLQIKKIFVENDEFDNEKRQILNFGHTYGHAYEAYYNYEKYLHGEAVALGMLKACAPDLVDDLKFVLDKFSLPTFDPVDKEELLTYIKRDKKSRADGINLVLVDKIGHAYIQNKKIVNL